MTPGSDEFAARGFERVTPVLDGAECDGLLDALPDVAVGSRSLLSLPIFRALPARLRAHRELAGRLTDLVAVQGIVFSKTRSHNWSLKLHRDSIVPMGGTGELKPAGEKEGRPFVHAPQDLLARCVAVRLSLDEVPEGDLRVVPGSHVAPFHPPEASGVPEVVRVPRGGALVVRPLLLHGSAKLTDSPARRVLHFLFAPGLPAEGYHWHDRI